MYRVELATLDDMAELSVLMDRAIRELQAPYLSAAEIEASFEFMGIDTALVRDGTYFKVVEDGAIIGCGGWSRRATLFGGDHTSGRDARRLDPSSEPARVRAMYTHPGHARRGIGRAVLEACEAAARAEGFRTLELAGTVAGQPLYLAWGFVDVEPIHIVSSRGVPLVFARMTRQIPAAPSGGDR
jgi:GNAT superfamily N-acetyltransferase